jgi:hypothetical protein
LQTASQSSQGNSTALTRDIMNATAVTLAPVVEHDALMGVETKRGLLAGSGLAADDSDQT